MISRFRYVAYDQFGAKHEGSVESGSERQALEQLRAEGLFPAELKRLASPGSQVSLGSLFGSSQMSLADLELLTSELSILLTNGVRIDRALAVLSKAFVKPGVNAVVADLLKRVRSGEPFSECLGYHSKHFDPLYINLVRLGEASGDLARVFQRLSADLKFRRDLNSKVLQALTYPAVVLFVCVACIVFVFNFIVPQMSGLFEDAVEIPVYTAFLLATSEWFQNYQFWLLGFCIAMPLVLPRLLRQFSGSRIVDGYLLRVPVVRHFVLLLERVRLNSSLSLMLESGVPVDKALSLASESIANSQLQHGIRVAQDKVSKGATLSQVLRLTPLFPFFSLSLIEVGEESGELSPVFAELADRARMELESWLIRLTNLLEPLLILFMGGIVGSVVITMLLSIVSVNDVGF